MMNPDNIQNIIITTTYMVLYSMNSAYVTFIKTKEIGYIEIIETLIDNWIQILFDRYTVYIIVTES